MNTKLFIKCFLLQQNVGVSKIVIKLSRQAIKLPLRIKKSDTSAYLAIAHTLDSTVSLCFYVFLHASAICSGLPPDIQKLMRVIDTWFFKSGMQLLTHTS